MPYQKTNSKNELIFFHYNAATKIIMIAVFLNFFVFAVVTQDSVYCSSFSIVKITIP